MRLSDPPAPSYYAATAGDDKLAGRARLQGDHLADVTVVGGGIAGCSAALYLAKRGYKVALLEARFVGYGASGRSGGQTIFGLAASHKALVAQVGPGDARRLFDLSVEALDCTRELIREHRIDCDYRSNHVHVATKQRHVRELAEWAEELHGELGYQSPQLLNRDELQAHVRSERYLAGLLDPRSGHLHPLKYTQGLARAAELAGVRIFEGSQVLRYESGAGVTVHAPGGTVRCAHLILCGNAYIDGVAPPLARRILGVGTYIAATEPLDPARARSLLPSNAAIADINWILDYFRLTGDHRLLFGGRVSYSGMEPPHLAESMRKRMVRVFPDLAGVKVAYTWGGYLDITMSRAPDFGRLAPNIFYLQGFSGHGMTLAGLGGRLVAEAVSGTAERFDVFARIPHRDFPGGPLLRRPSLMLAMLYYRLRDLL
ncbi:MAG: gamma-glutamylputrescine oxidase [Gammaproteobacteria bacterium]|nr:gamma-glutamylputrescine oxidase [Gammaproteobacteria bacterium]